MRPLGGAADEHGAVRGRHGHRRVRSGGAAGVAQRRGGGLEPGGGVTECGVALADEQVVVAAALGPLVGRL